MASPIHHAVVHKSTTTVRIYGIAMPHPHSLSFVLVRRGQNMQCLTCIHETILMMRVTSCVNGLSCAHSRRRLFWLHHRHSPRPHHCSHAYHAYHSASSSELWEQWPKENHEILSDPLLRPQLVSIQKPHICLVYSQNMY